MADKNKKNKNKANDIKQSALYMWRYNLLKIFTFDQSVSLHFKPNLTDTFQSFALIFIALPCEILSIYFTYDPANFNNISYNSLTLVASIGFMMSHIIYYLILSKFAVLWQRWPEFLCYIQMRNLLVTSFIIIELLILFTIKIFGLSNSLFISATFLFGLYSIFLQWFIIRISLGTEPLPTIGLILMDNFLYILVTFGLVRIVFGTIF